MKLKKEQWVVLLIGFPVIAFFLWEFIFSALYFTNKKDPDHFILSPDYSGWVIIEYQNSNCKPLQKNTNTWIYSIPATGKFCTSTSPGQGWSKNKFSYENNLESNLKQNPKTGANHIWHEDHIQYHQKPYYLFYVGPQKFSKETLPLQEPTVQKLLDEPFHQN